MHGIVWRFPTEGPIDLTPAAADEIVLVGSADGVFSSLDGQTGKFQGRSRTRGRVTTPADIANGVVYLGDNAGTLYAFDLQTCEELWIWDETGFVNLLTWIHTHDTKGSHA